MERNGSFIALNAVVVGGGRGRDHLGVWLSHDPTDFGIAAALTPLAKSDSAAARRSIRTGFSEAWATDVQDDSYDLSWHNELPEDDVAAVARLRQLLATDPDPIDRHYMFGELESRLYRRGADDEEALSEFDAACRAHHVEMGTIRSAFIAEWGAVPLLNTYRQMAIRQQKAKDWEASRWWAEQGIQMYDGKAARAEWVADLEKRRDRSVTKIEQLNQPARARPTPRQPTEEAAPTPTAMETLTCQRCDAQFERSRTRGRKPLMCPDCRRPPNVN